MRALRLFGIVAVWLLSACLNLWAMAALYFDFSRAGREWLPPAIYLVVLTLFLALLKSRVFRIGACFTGFFIVLVCWLSLKPSNDRDWQSNLSRTPRAEITGDRVTIPQSPPLLLPRGSGVHLRVAHEGSVPLPSPGG